VVAVLWLLALVKVISVCSYSARERLPGSAFRVVEALDVVEYRVQIPATTTPNSGRSRRGLGAKERSKPLRRHSAPNPSFT
jgi:hypothetical protein